jgi:hypothetical protein
MNSENEKLRALLKRLYPSVSISDQVRIDEALSQQAEQWISVHDKLPECGERVLCWIDIGDMKYTEVVTWHGSFFGDIVALKVTHWLPLPSPPTP